MHNGTKVHFLSQKYIFPKVTWIFAPKFEIEKEMKIFEFSWPKKS